MCRASCCRLGQGDGVPVVDDWCDCWLMPLTPLNKPPSKGRGPGLGSINQPPARASRAPAALAPVGAPFQLGSLLTMLPNAG